ncbi:hypothetical protein [Streptomyces sp. PRh5]|uniref:hypothetical protein n=1 Tax=Streptomyces sp. PRh5 TaxID=1158056 RepID=UPI0004BBFCBB|nr:hypothetical protein [Streptomyces sp. PRh5]
MQSRHTQRSAVSTFDNILAAGAKSGMVPHEYVDSLGDTADAGSEVLVSGTSDRVGSYVVQQLPAVQQVEVVATDTAADFERLRELGAPKIIDDNAGSVADQGLVAYDEGRGRLHAGQRRPGPRLDHAAEGLAILASGSTRGSPSEFETDVRLHKPPSKGQP